MTSGSGFIVEGAISSFRRDLKTFLFHSVYGHQDTDRLCDGPQFSSTGAPYKCLSYSYSYSYSSI